MHVSNIFLSTMYVNLMVSYMLQNNMYTLKPYGYIYFLVELGLKKNNSR